MWIAFKNYYLRDTKQPICSNSWRRDGCELLSKIIIFVTRNNAVMFPPFAFSVVNCFQKLLSSWHETTRSRKSTAKRMLWIAFKNYYLRDTKQHLLKNYVWRAGCELLSKIIIFVTRNNKIKRYTSLCYVVNCFQKLLSSWHETTVQFPELQPHPLWIAFKNYYLRDTTQRCSWKTI